MVTTADPPPVALASPAASVGALRASAATPAPGPVAAGPAMSENAIRAVAKAVAAEVVSTEIGAVVTRLSRIEEQLKKLAERDAFTARTPPPPVVSIAQDGGSPQGVPAPSIAPAPWHVPVSESIAPSAAPSPSVPPPRARMSSIPIALPAKVELSIDLENALDGSKRKRRTAAIVVFVLIGLVGGLVAMMLASQIKA